LHARPKDSDDQVFIFFYKSVYIVLRGPGIPAGNQFPTRIPYPVYLQSLNTGNVAAASATMGGDTSDKKVWWKQ
jgi:hypothetical protein